MKIIVDMGPEYPTNPVASLVDLCEWVSMSGPEEVAKYTTLEYGPEDEAE